MHLYKALTEAKAMIRFRFFSKGGLVWLPPVEKYYKNFMFFSPELVSEGFCAWIASFFSWTLPPYSSSQR